MKCFSFVDEQKEKKGGVGAASESLRLECVYRFQAQQAQTCQVKPDEKMMSIMCEAVQFVDHSKRKSLAMAY